MNKPCNFCEHRHFKEEEPSEEVYKMSVEKYIEWEKSIPCRNCTYNDWDDNYKELLKRCPFCGGEADVYIEEIYSDVFSCTIECSECEASVTASSKERAIKKWSRRV